MEVVWAENTAFLSLFTRDGVQEIAGEDRERADPYGEVTLTRQ